MDGYNGRLRFIRSNAFTAIDWAKESLDKGDLESAGKNYATAWALYNLLEDIENMKLCDTYITRICGESEDDLPEIHKWAVKAINPLMNISPIGDYMLDGIF